MIMDYSELCKITNNTMLIWKESRNIASAEISDKLDRAMSDWVIELTSTLNIWLSKGSNLTTGELILARVNMGSLVESWMKFFYCVYLDDYRVSPKLKKGIPVDPDDKNMTFEDLKQYSRGILWEKDDAMDKWVNKIQSYRNAIHSFQPRSIGTAEEFESDFKTYCELIESIYYKLPPLEEFLERFPYGYTI